MNKQEIRDVITEVVSSEYGTDTTYGYSRIIEKVVDALAEKLANEAPAPAPGLTDAQLEALVDLGVRLASGSSEDQVRDRIKRTLAEAAGDEQEEAAASEGDTPDVDYGPVDAAVKDEDDEPDAEVTVTESVVGGFTDEQESDKSDEPSSQLDRIETRIIAVSGDVEAILSLAKKLRKQGKHLVEAADRIEKGLFGTRN